MGESNPRRSLADKLNALFERVTRRSGQEFTYEEVANAIQEKGVTISQSYIWQLRKGKKDNPTIKHVQALADFFGVPPAYFFDDEATDRITEQLDHLRAEQRRLREITSADDVQLVAMRASQMDPATRQVFAELMASVVRDQRARQQGNTEADTTNTT